MSSGGGDGGVEEIILLAAAFNKLDKNPFDSDFGGCGCGFDFLLIRGVVILTSLIHYDANEDVQISIRERQYFQVQVLIYWEYSTY